MNRPARNLYTGLIRLPPHEALAFRAFDRRKRAVDIATAEPDAVIVAEIKFGKVAVQMLFGAMLIDALHAAFEDRKRAFDSIGVDHIYPPLGNTPALEEGHISASTVLHGLMIRKFGPDFRVEAAFVSVQAAFFGDIFLHDCLN